MKMRRDALCQLLQRRSLAELAAQYWDVTDRRSLRLAHHRGTTRTDIDVVHLWSESQLAAPGIGRRSLFMNAGFELVTGARHATPLYAITDDYSLIRKHRWNLRRTEPVVNFTAVPGSGPQHARVVTALVDQLADHALRADR